MQLIKCIYTYPTSENVYRNTRYLAFYSPSIPKLLTGALLTKPSAYKPLFQNGISN